MKEKFLSLYCDIAERIAELSYAERLKVGAVIVKDHRILSYGYNGTPSGFENVCEVEIPEVVDFESRSVTESYKVTKPEVIHAEQNALMKVTRSHDSTEGAAMFITHSPCVDCAKLILQSGVREVYFIHAYRNDAGLKVLEAGGVVLHRVSKADPPLLPL